MRDYLDFAQKNLGEERELEDLPCLSPDLWCLIIDGHSRYGACLELAELNPTIPHFLGCTAIETTGVADIITRQIAANIQARPSKDREAHALAAAYEMQRALDPHMTMTSFEREHGISAPHLSDCLNYSNLPEVIKDMVGQDQKGLPFTIAVQIAKTQELLSFYYNQLDGKTSDKNMTQELIRYALWYTSKKPSASSVITKIRETINGLKQEMVRRGWEWNIAEFKRMNSGPVELSLFQEQEDRAAMVEAELKRLIAEQKSTTSQRKARITHLAEAALAQQEELAA